MKYHYVLIQKSFFDSRVGRERLPEEGVVELPEDQVEELLPEGYVRHVKRVHPSQEEKMHEGPPEDKSLSGPPENKANKRNKLESLTVPDLRDIVEDLDVDLPSGYVKRAELIELILEAM